ncbi:hypothetical protein Back2_00210 [Nocardioides baekrokdamisoli]|uniref:ABC transporter substrate-binding protein n=1 Tax=Nocardioides baekrokdamisoli TaxID=1804624 RepID=A0A3G9IX44_9ACTN|nr:MCE family protein [Nocardioides baekrokdamisoli]BBH15734.1 hypothetical protein Back2_00210 [Nocardioides baekrokdamisoli]
MNPAMARDGREGRVLASLGVAFLAIVVGLVALSIAFYDHAFASEVPISVQVGEVPPELNVGGDVRMNGAIIGRVTGVAPDSGGARINLDLEASQAAEVPAGALVRILPTTLFGQKYVEITSTADPAAGHVTAGSVLQEDRSAQAVELTTVMDDLYPVLTAVHPDSLAAALGALANGLDGKGSAIHDDLLAASRYLKQINAHGPELSSDIALLDQVSGRYAALTPQLIDLLKQAGTGVTALAGSNPVLTAFLGAVSQAADSGRALLAANQQQLAQAALLSEPTLALLARYSPEIPCVIGGFLKNAQVSAAEVRGDRFQGYFTLGQQANGYAAADRTRNGDLGVGPACRGLVNAPVPYPAVKLNDGVRR